MSCPVVTMGTDRSVQAQGLGMKAGTNQTEEYLHDRMFTLKVVIQTFIKCNQHKLSSI